MKVQARIIFAMMIASLLSGCETVYMAPPIEQPSSIYVNPPVVVGYPSQPQAAQVPAPIQTPPLPPSVPAKPPEMKAPPPPVVLPAKAPAPAVIPASQPLTGSDVPVMHAAPEKPPGSMSELPDPS